MVTTRALTAALSLPGGVINIAQYGAVGDASTDCTAAIDSALAIINSTGIHVGGWVYIPPAGDYIVKKQFIVASNGTTIGSVPGGAESAIIRTHSTYPSAVISGGSFSLPAATITVASMPANARSTGGQLSLISTTGNQLVSYTGISGNTFTGGEGGTGTVADASIVGFPVFVLGTPWTGGQPVFATSVRDFQVNLSPDNTVGNATPGGLAVASTRIQELSGADFFRVRYAKRGFIHIKQPPAGVTPLNWHVWETNMGFAGASTEATAVGYDIDMNRAGPDRGIQHATISSAAGAPTTAGTKGILRIGSMNTFDFGFQFEYMSEAYVLDNSGASAKRNGPCFVQGLYTSSVTTAFREKTVSGDNGDYEVRDVRKDNGSTNLIVDDRTGITITDNTTEFYRVFGGDSTQQETVQTSAIGRATTQTRSKNFTATGNIDLGHPTSRANATSGAIILTLPTAIGVWGTRQTVIKTDVSANTVTIATTSAQTINGASTKVLSTQYDKVTVESDNSNWLIVA